METVSTLTQTSAALSNTPPATSKNELSGDFDTFLTLLTAQLRNQDPLEPVDSTEFVAQLASFSAVEQQVQSNTKLDNILDVLASGATGGLTQWIGQEVRNPGSAAYENQPVDVLYLSHTDSDRVELVVYDENDNVVARQNVNKDESNVQWSGTLLDGGQAVQGYRYRFETNSYLEGEVIANTPALVFSTVEEVRRFNGQAVLYFADGTQMYAADVEAMRTPQA